MDFRKRELDFEEADRRYAELAEQRDAGSISDEEFDEQRQRLMVRDDEGHWWAKLGESGEWHYRDEGTWIPGTPPVYREDTQEFTTDGPPPTQAQPLPSEDGETGRQRLPIWIPIAGLGGIALVGIVLIVWVLLPYLQSGSAPGEPSESMLSKQGESASTGTAFAAVFVHRATPENISANSTYLDNPQINGDPNVVLYVTQNWNPGGVEDGIYNDHAVGVWYDSDRQRWAIFNQDREPMPDGAAFNVGVLEGQT